MRSIATARLDLEPLVVTHAKAMSGVLSDDALYRYLDTRPSASLDDVRRRYARLETRESPDRTQRWLNWIIVPHRREPIGFVQATIREPGTAWIAYLLATAESGKGYATEAVVAMIAHLTADSGISRYLAIVEANHRRSIALLERVGFRPAEESECEGHGLTADERLFVRG